MTETIQISLYDAAHFAISLANGRQYELGPGEVIEVQHAGRWQRAQVEKNLWAEYCAVLVGGVTLRLSVGMPARLPDGNPGVPWAAGAGQPET